MPIQNPRGTKYDNDEYDNRIYKLLVEALDISPPNHPTNPPNHFCPSNCLSSLNHLRPLNNSASLTILAPPNNFCPSNCLSSLNHLRPLNNSASLTILAPPNNFCPSNFLSPLNHPTSPLNHLYPL
ncbi:hypothetical protein M8J76_003093 [Diaphorina citri]|nr:hypothetical protein M8J76_003093 [Diaphorina citri]